MKAYIFKNLFLSYFIKISDGTTGFLDENWSNIVKNIKKSKYDLLRIL